MLIVRELFEGCTRFDEIEAQTGATAQMVAARLKRLEAEGLIEQRRFLATGMMIHHPHAARRSLVATSIKKEVAHF